MKKRIQLWLSLLAFVTLVGCGSVASYSKTSNLSLQSQSPNCEFKIFTIRPAVQFDELGVIDFSPLGPLGQYGPKSLQEARKLASRYVCSSGGNGLLLTVVNDAGQYIKASVILLQE